MGTSWRVELFASGIRKDRSIQAAIELELDRLAAELSQWREDSVLSRFNSAAAGEWVTLPPDLFHVMETSLSVADLTDGAFDPTTGPLVDAWGFGSKPLRGAPPSESERAIAWARLGARKIHLDPSNMRACQPGGVKLDFSAIAKGFVVDRIAQLLDIPGISSCLVEIGGELRGRGLKQDGHPWWIAIERPPDDAPQKFPDLSIALCGFSVASSGNYRRFFEHEGVRYSHIIDPRTGVPVRHGVASVSVVHEYCMLADAFSTALTVMGHEAGLAFADRHEIAALFVLRGSSGSYETRTSRLFQQMLET